MLILEKLKKISFDIATFGGLGDWKSGGILASFLAFPILLLGKVLYNFIPTYFFWIISFLILLSFLVIFLALRFISDKYPSQIVLDKVIGMVITFVCVPLKWKLMLFGFIFFHALNFFRTFLFCKTLGEKMDDLPFGLGIIVGDIISGLMCNIVLHLIVWIMN